MGTAERREREKQQRKTDIIDAAENIFFTKGFENATMDDVAKEAELSKGTLYLYFTSKEEVYLAIMLRAMKLLTKLFAEAVKNEPNGLCKVRAIGETYIRFNNEFPNYYHSLLYFGSIELNPDSPIVSEIKAFHEGKDVMDIFIESIQEGINDGTIRNDVDPARTAILLWGATSGVLQLMTFKKNAIDYHFKIVPEDLISYYMNFIYHSLKA